MTETTGATCVTFPDDLSLGHVGGPFPCCEVRSQRLYITIRVTNLVMIFVIIIITVNLIFIQLSSISFISSYLI
jgi:hypothetical protein